MNSVLTVAISSCKAPSSSRATRGGKGLWLSLAFLPAGDEISTPSVEPEKSIELKNESDPASASPNAIWRNGCVERV